MEVDFVKIDNYQDRFAFMLLDRIEKLEKHNIELEQQLNTIQTAIQVRLPQKLTVEIFNYTSTFLYIKFPTKYLLMTTEKQKELIENIFRIFLKYFKNIEIHIDVFLYTTSFIQFNISFGHPIHYHHLLPDIYQDISIYAKDNIQEFPLEDELIFTKFAGRIYKDGSFICANVNNSLDINPF